MTCQQAREQFLTPSAELEAHLSGCPSCTAEATSLREVWDRMEGHLEAMLPEQEPAPEVSARFYAMLEGYRQGQEAAAQRVPWHAMFPRPAFQAAMAATLLCVGGLSGFLITGRTPGNQELSSLRKEVHSTRQLVVLSMMQQQSASERLEGVSWTRRLERPDPEVKEALLEMLDSDANVNVRLAAVDALRRMASPEVRRAMRESLLKQSSPMVQVALIDLLVEIGERPALEVFKRIHADGNNNPAVRQRANWGMQQLGGGL